MKQLAFSAVRSANFGLSEATLERMRYSGELAALRLSERRIGYRVTDLPAWLDARASAGNEAA
jgi:hypothetical protein